MPNNTFEEATFFCRKNHRRHRVYEIRLSYVSSLRKCIMLTKLTPPPVCNIVSQLVAEIRNENSNFHPLRKIVRDSIVIPVLVCDRSGNEISGFTRDLSAHGVCLITNRKFHTNDHWIIDLYRLDGRSNAILSECRWSQRFGDSFWLSGWKFQRAVE